MHGFNRRLGVREAVPLARQNVLVDPSVQIREAFGELQFGAVDRNRPKRGFLSGLGDVRKVTHFHRKKPTHPRPFEFKQSRSSPRFEKIDLLRNSTAEEPNEQVEKMD